MSNESSDDTSSIIMNVVSFVFVGGILELLGMLLYLSVTSEAALNNLTAGGISLGEVIAFLLASPDRLLVAGALALLAFLFVWVGDSGQGNYGVGGDL